MNFEFHVYSTSHIIIAKESRKKGTDVLNVVMDSCKHSAVTLQEHIRSVLNNISKYYRAIAFDELADMISSTSIHEEMVTYIYENMANQFPDNFIAEVTSLEGMKECLPKEFIMCPRDDTETANSAEEKIDDSLQSKDSFILPYECWMNLDGEVR